MINLNQFEVISFDCYGTLIDWENGLLPVLQHLLSDHNITLSNDHALELFAELEAQAETGTYQPYRQVLQQVVMNIGNRFNFIPTEAELNCLSDSIQNWLPFPDTVAALKILKQKYRLAIISNIDDDLFTATAQHLQVEFDWVITAQQLQSYKPAIANFRLAQERMNIASERWLHLAQSLYHDIAPANSLGLTTVWVNRRRGQEGAGATLPAQALPDLEVPDLQTLAASV